MFEAQFAVFTNPGSKVIKPKLNLSDLLDHMCLKVLVIIFWSIEKSIKLIVYYQVLSVLLGLNFKRLFESLMLNLVSELYIDKSLI
jgi:hypothetical protein